MPSRQPGDVLLVRGSGAISDGIVAAQKLIASIEPLYSHALVTHSPDTFIHSTAEGVHVATYWDIFPSTYSTSKLLALRHRDHVSLSNRQFVRGRIEHYYGQAYNSAFFMKKLFRRSDSTAFCSELIGKIYQDLKIPLLPHRPDWIFPVHLQMLSDSEDWQDVTSSYVSPSGSDILALAAVVETLSLDSELKALLNRGISSLGTEDDCRSQADEFAKIVRSSYDTSKWCTDFLEKTVGIFSEIDKLSAALGGDQPVASLPPEMAEMIVKWNTLDWYWDQFVDA